MFLPATHHSTKAEMDGIFSMDWAATCAWANSEIDRLRKTNDSIELDAEATAVVRGEIRVLKRLIDLPKLVARKNAATAPRMPDLY